MKPKVKNWIAQLNNGKTDTNITKIIWQIHHHTFKGKGYTSINELRTELKMAHQTLTANLSLIEDEGIKRGKEEWLDLMPPSLIHELNQL